jgi:hypothetical protein
MHRCSREKKKDSKHARVSVQVLALALGTLYSVLYVLYILSSYARRRASLFLRRRRRLLVAGESGVRQCDGATCEACAACGSAACCSGVRRRCARRAWRAAVASGAACCSGVWRRWRGGCGGSGVRSAACGVRRAVAVCGGGGAAGAAAMGRLFTLTRHHTYIAQHTLCLSHPQLDCKVGLLCK